MTGPEVVLGGAVAPPLPVADVVTDALTGVAGVLEVPVHVAALVLALALVLECGRAAAEALRRQRPGRRPLTSVLALALADPARAPNLARSAPNGLAERAVLDIVAARATGREEAVEHALADFELAVQRRLDRTRLLVRAGPAVGLMGTLIPLGPGIAALGRGDIASLASDLRTAFAATVVGILVGTVAFALTLVRTRTSTEELAALERGAMVHRPADPEQARPTRSGARPSDDGPRPSDDGPRPSDDAARPPGDDTRPSDDAARSSRDATRTSGDGTGP